MDLRRVVHQLIEATGHEIGELHLDHGAQAVHRGTDGIADDGALGERGVHDALGAEFVDKALGDAKRAAVNADIFAETEHVFVGLHFGPQTCRDAFNKCASFCHGGRFMDSARPRQPHATRPRVKKSPHNSRESCIMPIVTEENVMGRLLLGLVVVCAGVLSAQDASDYFESMRLGEAALAEKKPNHNGAHTHFRDAAFTAQAMGRARFEAMALHELAQLHERDTWAERRKDAPPALLDRAEKLAQEASNPALQARILVSAAVYGDTTAWARALDIAAAQSDLWVLERGYMLAKTDEQKALWRKAADLHDRLHFMWRHNDEPDLDGLAALIKEATEAKLPLFAWRVDIYRAAKGQGFEASGRAG